MALAVETPENEIGGPIMLDTVDRHDWSVIGRARYRMDYMLPLKPVVITGGFDHWPARRKWTPEFFRDHHGDMSVKVGGKAWTLGALADLILTSTPNSPAPYLQQHHISGWPPALQDDICPLPECTQPNWLDNAFFPSLYAMKSTEFFFGGPGARFPFLHFDHWHMHAFLMQIYGVKEYVAFAPDQTPNLYAIGGEKENVSQIDSIDRPDLTRFPLLMKARGIRFLLHPGETLYVPCGWWHTARILSPSITVSVAGANAANWSYFKADMLRDHAKRSTLRTLALSSYLSIFERLMPMIEDLGASRARE